jgi:hypothetical protein
LASKTGWTRRSLLGGTAAALASEYLFPAAASAQVTDLRGLDALWRDALC